MDRLIVDVLNYSRIVRSELRLERVPLGALLEDLIETYPMFTPDKADIEVAGPLPTVLGNDAMLTQVFSNLIGNAVKFTPQGIKPRIKIWSEFHGPFVRVLVQDHGIGIAPDQHQKIFEVFQQAETSYGGTGIGLSIVKKAIERIGGEVGVSSEPGKGSTFWVEIPRAD
jgi:signal transduction histidine kinase